MLVLRGIARASARRAGLRVELLSCNALHEPTTVRLRAGQKGNLHWGTLMPFVGACRDQFGPVARPAPPPDALAPPPSGLPASVPLADLRLIELPTRAGTGGAAPSVFDWATPIRDAWPSIGEAGAARSLEAFVSATSDGARRFGLASYEASRSRADAPDATSRLSAHLRFGELSARQVHWAVADAVAAGALGRDATKTFARRLYWRDLAYFHHSVFIDMNVRGIRGHYDRTAWRDVKSEPGASLTPYTRRV